MTNTQHSRHNHCDLGKKNSTSRAKTTESNKIKVMLGKRIERWDKRSKTISERGPEVFSVDRKEPYEVLRT